MEIVHKKNTPYYLSFPMVDAVNPEDFKSGITVVCDTCQYKDGAGNWTIIPDPVTGIVEAEGNGGVYVVTLPVRVTNHDRVFIKFMAGGEDVGDAADTYFLFRMVDNDVDDVADSVVAAIAAIAALEASVAAIPQSTAGLGENVI